MYNDARFKFDSFLTGFCIFAATIKLASRGESSTYSLKTYVTGKLKPLKLTIFDSPTPKMQRFPLLHSMYATRIKK